MAQIVENPKGFRVISCSAVECFVIFGGLGVCDFCNITPGKGYYVAVLNHWYCPECYERWVDRAVRYSEDIHIEEKNYQHYLEQFKLK